MDLSERDYLQKISPLLFDSFEPVDLLPYFLVNQLISEDDATRIRAEVCPSPPPLAPASAPACSGTGASVWQISSPSSRASSPPSSPSSRDSPRTGYVSPTFLPLPPFHFALRYGSLASELRYGYAALPYYRSSERRLGPRPFDRLAYPPRSAFPLPHLSGLGEGMGCY